MDTPNPNNPPPPGSQPPPPSGQPTPSQPGGVPPQQYPAQPYPAQPYPAQPNPAQPYPPQPNPAQQPAAPPQQPGGYAQPGYQQPGAPQPGYGQPPFAPEQPKKKSRWWIWVLAILFVFALLIGGCGFVLFRAVSGPIDKANEVLSLLEQGEVEDASDLLDFDCFGNDGLDTFEEFFTENPVEDYNLSGTSNNNGRGGATGTVSLADGLGERAVSFDLTNDDGWQVCGIDIDEP